MAAALAPSGCSLNPEPPLRVGANIWPGYECLFIARSLGLFQPRPIKLVEYASAPEVVRAFKNRAIEVAALTGDEFLRLAATQPDVCAILMMDISKGADALLARPEHTSLADLRGKKVGVEVNALGGYMLTRALSSAGIRKDEVEVVPVENDQHQKAFADGRVDAVVSFEPHRSRLLKDGARVLFDSSRINGEIVDYLVTRDTILSSRAPALKALLKGWFEARERLLTNGDETARLVASREGVSTSEFLNSLDLIELPSLDKNKQMLGTNGRCMANLSTIHAVMVENGLVTGSLPGGKLFDGGFLP